MFCLFWALVCEAQQPTIDSLENVIALNRGDAGMAKALNSASQYFMRRDSETTKKYAYRAKVLSEEIGSELNLSASYVHLVNLHKSTIQRDSGESYLDQSTTAKQTIGFMAQEVQPLFPELVETDEDGYLGLNSSGFGVIAIKAIQEQQLEIETLKKQLSDQQAEMAEIKKLLQAPE